jgi:hypothetical protein
MRKYSQVNIDDSFIDLCYNDENTMVVATRANQSPIQRIPLIEYVKDKNFMQRALIYSKMYQQIMLYHAENIVHKNLSLSSVTVDDMERVYIGFDDIKDYMEDDGSIVYIGRKRESISRCANIMQKLEGKKTEFVNAEIANIRSNIVGVLERRLQMEWMRIREKPRIKNLIFVSEEWIELFFEIEDLRAKLQK